MSIHLTYDQAAELLGRAVAEKGADYIYEDDSYVYVNEYGAPMCIVGHVLYYADGEVPFLAHDSLNEHRVCLLVRDGVIDADERTIRLLSVAQISQDDGKTWGESVERAKKETEE